MPFPLDSFEDGFRLEPRPEPTEEPLMSMMVCAECGVIYAGHHHIVDHLFTPRRKEQSTMEDQNDE